MQGYLLIQRIVQQWEKVQVELHGKVSAERMYRYKAYSEKHSAIHALCVLLFTPIPCLVLVTCMDSIPLEKPSAGSLKNFLFWIRALLMIWCMHLAVFTHLRRYIPQLPVKSWQILLATACIACGSVGFMFTLSLTIGFPVPFCIGLASPVACVLIAIFFAICWGKIVKKTPGIGTALYHYVIFICMQVGITYVYPAFNYVFINLEGSSQTLFSMVLPLMKIGMKNVANYLLRHMNEDNKPEDVVFNIDIFHALFVALCMQRATSNITVIYIMVVDVLQLYASLCDVDKSVRVLKNLYTKIESGSSSKKFKAPFTSRSLLSSIKMTSISLSLIDTAIYLLDKDESLRRNLSIRFESFQQDDKATPSAEQSAYIPKKITPFTNKSHNKVYVSRVCQLNDHASSEPIKTHPHTNANGTNTETGPNCSATAIPSNPLKYGPRAFEAAASSIALTDEEKSRIHMLGDSDKVMFVQHVLRTLYLIEFLLLIEFIEVMVPIMYCIYLIAMVHLPNRIYYSQAEDIDGANLLPIVSSVLIYAFLEALSFIALCLLLRHKLRISPLRLVAFVLESNKQYVHGKLILWMVFFVQSSLEHFGVDYGFHFAWLKKTAET